MSLTITTPANMPRVHVGKQALFAVQGKSGPEILAMLGTLDAQVSQFKPDDEVMRLARETASIWRTELLRVMPGTYVSLSILR